MTNLRPSRDTAMDGDSAIEQSEMHCRVHTRGSFCEDSQARARAGAGELVSRWFRCFVRSLLITVWEVTIPVQLSPQAPVPVCIPSVQTRIAFKLATTRRTLRLVPCTCKKQFIWTLGPLTLFRRSGCGLVGRGLTVSGPQSKQKTKNQKHFLEQLSIPELTKYLALIWNLF